MSQGKDQNHAVINFNSQVFHAFHQNKNISIYSSGFINLVQILNCSREDIVGISSSRSKTALIVLSNTHLTIFVPYYSLYGTINFRLSHKTRISPSNELIEVSKSGEYVILTKGGRLEIMQVDWAYNGIQEVQAIEDVRTVAEMNFAEPITSHCLSQDEKYWVTSSEGSCFVYVWDFPSLVGNGMQASRTKAPQAISENNNNNNKSGGGISNFRLSHRHPIITFFFRRSQSTFSTKVTTSPNVLTSLDQFNFIYIWSEDTIKGGGAFYLTYTVRLQGIPNEVHSTMLWISHLKTSQMFKRAPEYLCGNSKHGVFSMSAGMPVILGALIPYKRLEVYRFYNVLSIEKEMMADEVIHFEHGIFRNMARLIEAKMNDSQIAQILGTDDRGNLLKVQLNMTNKEEIILFSNVETETFHSNRLYIEEDRATVSYVEEGSKLVMEQLQPSVVPKIFQKHKPQNVMEIENIDSLVGKYATFFSCKKTVFFLSDCLSKISFVLNDCKDMLFYSPISLLTLLEVGVSEIVSIREVDHREENQMNSFMFSFQTQNMITLVSIKYTTSQLLKVVHSTMQAQVLESNVMIPELFEVQKLRTSKISQLENVKMMRKRGEDKGVLVIGQTSPSTLQMIDIPYDNPEIKPIVMNFDAEGIISSFDLPNSFPFYCPLIREDKTMMVFKRSGKVITSFNLVDYLDRDSKSMEKTKKMIQNLNSHSNKITSKGKRTSPSSKTGKTSEENVSLEDVDCGVVSITPTNFLILLQDFALIASLFFDESSQGFKIQLLRKTEHSSELYYGRFSNYKYSAGDNIKILKMGIVLTSNSESFHVLDDNFDNLLFKNLGEDSTLVNNLRFKILELQKQELEYHPLHLMKLLLVGKFALSIKILVNLVEELERIEEDHESAPMFSDEMDENKEDLQDLEEQELDQNGLPLQALDILKRRDRRRRLNYKSDLQSSIDTLKMDAKEEGGLEQALDASAFKKLRELKKRIDLGEVSTLKPNEAGVLTQILELLEGHKLNKRGKDIPCALFFTAVLFYNLGQAGVLGLTKRKALRSKEVIWAMHTDSESAMMELCVPRSKMNDPNYLRWEKLRSYCVPMWFKDTKKLKAMIQSLSLLKFKETKDADDVILWNIMLDKLKIQISLYKMKGNVKLVKYLSNDFESTKWQKGARANAYKLFSQKRYVMAAAFFLLAKDLKEAVNMAVEQMGDLQLGIVMCRLLESPNSNDIAEKPILRGLIEKYIIEAAEAVGDFWLASIGNTMLEEHVESANCVSRIIAKTAAPSWKEDPKKINLYPLNSQFHPTAHYLLNYLKNSFKVKRELEGGQTEIDFGENALFAQFMSPGGGMGMGMDMDMGGMDMSGTGSSNTKESKKKLDIDQQQLIIKKLSFYYFYDLPNLGISMNSEDMDKESGHRKRLFFDYLEKNLVFEIGRGDWNILFKSLHSTLEKVKKFGVLTTDQIKKFILQRIKYLKTPKLLVAWFLSEGEDEQALKVTDDLSLEIQHLSLYIVKSNNFEMRPKNVWASTLEYINQLSECVLLLEKKMISDNDEMSVESKSNFQRSRVYSLLGSSMVGDVSGQRARRDSEIFLKDTDKLMETNFVEKTPILIIQIAYTMFLVAINLGIWDCACTLLHKIRDYLRNVKKNKTYTTWASLKKEIVDRNVRIILKGLDSYPEFYHMNPSHYQESNGIRKVIQGVSEQQIDCESFQTLSSFSKILLRTLFRWMFNQEIQGVFESNFKLSECNDIVSYQNQSISSLNAYISEYSSYLSHDLFSIINLYSPTQQLTVLEDLKIILQSSKDKNQAYSQCQLLKAEDVHLQDQKINPADVINIHPFLKKMEEMIQQRLFTIINTDCDTTIESYKAEMLGPGLEVIKFASDPNARGYKDIKFNSICFLKDHYSIEMVIQAQGTLTKYNLFNCLFGKNRQQNGLRLLQSELVQQGRFSGSYSENSIQVTPAQLEQKPLPLKLLYYSIFESQRKDILSIKNMAWNQLSYILFEEKEMLSYDLSELKCAATHPTFPLIFAGTKSKVLVIYSKTMAVTATLEAAKRSVVQVVINNSGDRIAGIDNNGDFFFWRFNLLSKKFSPKIHLSFMECTSLCFMSDSSRVLLSSNKKLYVLDTLAQNITKEQLNSKSVLDGNLRGITSVLYSPYLKDGIAILGKKGELASYSLENMMQLKEVSVGDNLEITSSVSNKIGTMIAVGLSDGRIMVYTFQGLTKVSEFDPFVRENDKRQNRSVISLRVIQDFLVAGSSNGIISIVTRL